MLRKIGGDKRVFLGGTFMIKVGKISRPFCIDFVLKVFLVCVLRGIGLGWDAKFGCVCRKVSILGG
jgi:hypothetical protein